MNALRRIQQERMPRAGGSSVPKSLIPFAIAVWAALILGVTSSALAGDAHLFSVELFGDPEVGCILTTDEGACGRGDLSGTLVPDGDASFDGEFRFNLPGLRDSGRRPLRRLGRGRLGGMFTPTDGGAPQSCLIKGSLRAHGIFLPTGASAQEFHTGSFEGHGRCGSERVRVRAIWSGSIGPVPGSMIFDFERFQGRLAGTLLFR